MPSASRRAPSASALGFDAFAPSASADLSLSASSPPMSAPTFLKKLTFDSPSSPFVVE
jgi:hypothetical protein